MGPNAFLKMLQQEKWLETRSALTQSQHERMRKGDNDRRLGLL